ncbi:hypothetical protein COU18_00270 [Candidatus Kaiserbacteria bacterium CG10_big_fil_rev_8_21_14_0_10_51_14]|uniref:DUF5671 domain-containing protein n=1 Tax=Candidatus Kaiserbacteria bacterium CG10_big_fil_rev_8_21_14_0_10_51_14 TaxID=1974610 RepID=A0A2H0UCQ4_9BACT|nr:MAG: hypothetical protein COU18_00270 [Candidatus Kaiserbacteria bacterium CG10_big_fil_rev_8_21_14_0_10_51_14]
MTLKFLRNIFVLVSIIAVMWAITAPIVHAATPAFVPLAETPSGPLRDIYDTSGDFSDFINGLFRFALVVGAIAAVLRIAYAGYLYMGSDMWSQKGVAKEILTDVTLGLLLLLSIWIILYQINPDILKLRALDVVRSNPATVPGSNSNAGQEGLGLRDTPGYQYPVYSDDYSRFSRVETGYDDSGNRRYCAAALGAGWVNVDNRFCGSGGTQTSSCCGYDRNYVPPPPIQEQGGGESTYGNEAEIPAGSWCYEAGYYGCFSSGDECGDVEVTIDEDSLISSCKQY